jgi:hypothetical protein
VEELRQHSLLVAVGHILAPGILAVCSLVVAIHVLRVAIKVVWKVVSMSCTVEGVAVWCVLLAAWWYHHYSSAVSKRDTHHRGW